MKTVTVTIIIILFCLVLILGSIFGLEKISNIKDEDTFWYKRMTDGREKHLVILYSNGEEVRKYISAGEISVNRDGVMLYEENTLKRIELNGTFTTEKVK